MGRKYNYHTINLQKELAEKIQEAVDSGKHGYISIPDFVRAAVRAKLRELGYLV
ncbi:hypothetical protein LCGC14_1079810 [marine sediment metagenome]|uniref:Ribbon-helix-helix protein CopG domain-containing protein n=1 Tax=marine sediment metagenome TaxID=412755 RepID=A0A0F9MK95_9ZZZZ